MNYAYIFRFREADTELFSMECAALFGVENRESVLISDVDVPIEHSPFAHEKMTILAEAEDPETLCLNVEALQLESDLYKVVFLGKRTQVDYELQLSVCKRIGNAIEGDFSLKSPRVLYGVVMHQNKWYFGSVEKMDKQWLKHQSKPHSYSYSLPVRLARICVSLSGRNDRHRVLVDPCCGVGTVLLEAHQLGYKITGIEMNPPIAEDAKANLEYYGYEGEVICADMQSVDLRADCAILDIPYGVMEKTDEAMQFELLKGCRRFADELILVSVSSMESLLVKAGWKAVRSAPFVKQQFVRTITWCVAENVQNNV